MKKFDSRLKSENFKKDVIEMGGMYFLVEILKMMPLSFYSNNTSC